MFSVPPVSLIISQLTLGLVQGLGGRSVGLDVINAAGLRLSEVNAKNAALIRIGISDLDIFAICKRHADAGSGYIAPMEGEEADMAQAIKVK